MIHKFALPGTLMLYTRWLQFTSVY